MASLLEEAQAELDAAEQAVADAKGKGVTAAIAASRRLSAAKRQLKAAQAGVSTTTTTATGEVVEKTATQINKEIGAANIAARAEARATTNTPAYEGAPTDVPTIKGFDITQRPEGKIENGFIIYYSWIGGASTGSWQPYRAPVTSENMEKYGSRVFGGTTQAEFGTSSQGANALVQQPLILRDPYGNIVGYKLGDKEFSYSGFSGGSSTGKTEKSRVTNPDGSVTITYTDGTTSTIPAPGSGGNYTGSGTTGDPLLFNGTPFTGTRGGARYVNGVLQTDSSGNNGGVYSGSGTSSSPLTLNGKPFTGVLSGINYVNGVAQQSGSFNTGSNTLTATDIETKARRTAQQDFKAALGELGLADLADEVDNMIRQDFTVAQIKMELPKTASYQLRFPGMAALRAAGRAINEATYISNEKGYLQTLRAYGLDTDILGSRSALGTYIANEVSPREFEERVNLASTRVNENQEVLETFKSFYPEVDKSGVITYLLNPKAGMAIIKKQVRTSEIGAAAASAGFARDLMGISNIETLLPAVGEQAYAGLRTEFQRARQLAQSQRRLAQIENQSYSDLEAIGAVVGDDAAKLLASERRAQREAARFSARGGITGASLASPTAI